MRRYANAMLLSVNVSKEVPVSTEKLNRNEIVGDLSGLDISNRAAAQALLLGGNTGAKKKKFK